MMYKYKVYSNILETPSVRSLTLVCKDNLRPLLYQPGQYAAISMHDRLRPTAARCFSISSSPAQQRTLQFSVRVNGKYTKALERLQKGDEVFVRGPFGSFIFNENVHSDAVFFAGGIGISPFMSMIRYASELKLKNKIHLVYSCRNQDDIPFLEELTALQKQNPFLQITYVITNGTFDRLQGRRVVSGRVDGENINSLGLKYSKEAYMICGPSLYITAIQTLLKNKGVPKDRILSEAFSHGSGNQSETLIRWPSNTYAMAGLSLILSGFFIVLADLNKTLPILEASDLSTQVATSSISMNGTDIVMKVNSLGPQVDTKIKQEPIIKYIYVNGAVPVVTPKPILLPVTTPAPVKIVAPTPAPKTVVAPASRPRTKVS